MTFKVYLAGRITEDSLESAYYWRKAACFYLARYNMIGVNPMEDCCYQDLVGGIYRKDEWDMDEIYYNDLHLLDNSDAILVNLDNLIGGLGSMFEVGWGYAKGLTIVTFGKKIDHPFITLPVSHHSEDMHDSIEWLASYRKPTICPDLHCL